jgi:hypothetical protein
MVPGKNTCCNAGLVAGIAKNVHRFIHRYFPEMEGKFPHVGMEGIADMADSAPVPDVPHIKKER